MIIDGITLAEGSAISNLTVDIGPDFPTVPDIGELFLKLDNGEYNMYIYHTGTWNRVADEKSITDTLGFNPVNKAGDTLTGPLILSGLPTQPLHATTKSYVDSVAGGGGSSSFTVTGDVTGTLDGGTDVLTLSASGVAAGSYKQIDVNLKGIVIGGSNPTTVTGYGITDAVTFTSGDTRYLSKTKIVSAPNNFTSKGSITLTTITGGKSRIATNAVGWQTAKVETYKNTGKFVFEASNITTNGSGYIGLANVDTPVTGGTPIGNPSGVSRSFAVATTGGTLTASNASITVSGSAVSASANVPYMFAVDLDAGKAWICYNNVWANSGNPETGINPTFSWAPGSLSLAPAGTPNQLGQGGALDFNFGTTNFVNNVPAGFTAGWGEGSITVDGLNEVGFKNIPQVSISSNYTCISSDSGKHILHPGSDTTARTFTIPSNASVAYQVGTALTFINQNGAGAITIAIATDVMRLAGAGTTGARTLAPNGIATAVKIAATEWLISGTNLT